MHSIATGAKPGGEHGPDRLPVRHWSLSGDFC
jgi:hypothetical protein